ncbi:conserved hypothetical protein [Xenorhabdus nematophila F1]|uniref:Uncharacterized protein n=1 Tax=Xenorhabdus nematophila (strain ATCC 19061 / DSM 3370 / CCUG 14189 / LMG 1036 / NCIMB 9965 / AN6) TaxID=406817 RepID=D3VLN4_XENNA|nr:hypothetical protein D3790_02400 [Xenorhabdus nematophila]MCB4424540.1 hypothetical protein [Xenorhabdus nematophila]CBJ91360.1 hypothetical protein XNC1_3308 [Xenorhabdus nematophila ATCC 19061]CCW29880.1 conserved hypothetical protein [Xenorhabdus nematophila F1]
MQLHRGFTKYLHHRLNPCMFLIGVPWVQPTQNWKLSVNHYQPLCLKIGAMFFWYNFRAQFFGHSSNEKIILPYLSVYFGYFTDYSCHNVVGR